MKKKSHNQQPPKQPLSEKLIAFFAGFFVCLVGCLMFSHFKQDPVPPFRPDEPEWLSWPPLDLKPNEEESQLILPFLQGRQALQNALEEWFRDNSQDVYSYVDLMVENSFPPLSVNIEELFKCKKEMNEMYKKIYYLENKTCDTYKNLNSSENNKFIQNKRGRKITKKDKKNTNIHDKYAEDNILRKIQVHYLSKKQMHLFLFLI